MANEDTLPGPLRPFEFADKGLVHLLAELERRMWKAVCICHAVVRGRVRQELLDVELPRAARAAGYQSVSLQALAAYRAQYPRGELGQLLAAQNGNSEPTGLAFVLPEILSRPEEFLRDPHLKEVFAIEALIKGFAPQYVLGPALRDQPECRAFADQLRSSFRFLHRLGLVNDDVLRSKLAHTSVLMIERQILGAPSYEDLAPFICDPPAFMRSLIMNSCTVGDERLLGPHSRSILGRSRDSNDLTDPRASYRLDEGVVRRFLDDLEERLADRDDSTGPPRTASGKPRRMKSYDALPLENSVDPQFSDPPDRPVPYSRPRWPYVIKEALKGVTVGTAVVGIGFAVWLLGDAAKDGALAALIKTAGTLLPGGVVLAMAKLPKAQGLVSNKLLQSYTSLMNLFYAIVLTYAGFLGLIAFQHAEKLSALAVVLDKLDPRVESLNSTVAKLDKTVAVVETNMERIATTLDRLDQRMTTREQIDQRMITTLDRWDQRMTAREQIDQRMIATLDRLDQRTESIERKIDGGSRRPR